MHSNKTFNIIQHGCGFKKTFVVIKGQRLPSGAPHVDARVISVPMSREEAISLADQYESLVAA